MKINKKGYSEEECRLRMKIALEKKGIDYDEYVNSINEKKLRKSQPKEDYRPNHEDNVQLGCCHWDCGTIDYNVFI